MRFYNYRVKRKRRHHLLNSVNLDLHHRRRTSPHRGYHRRRHRGLAKALTIVAMVLVLLVGAGFGGFFYLKDSGRRSLRAAAETTQPDMGAQEDASGFVSRNGKRYLYNQEAINILCMGIDRRTELTESEGQIGENGQADTILMLSIDPEEGSLKVLAISRDTMTPVRTFDRQGNYIGKAVNHLAVAYSLGDGGKGSCELVEEAVSNLLYTLPVHGYVAVSMDSIRKLNDAVGGVTVTLSEEMNLAGQTYAAGTSVRLEGDMAESYVRSRGWDAEGSNTARMGRQKQYATAFVSAAAGAIRKNPTLVAELYSALTEDMVTSIGLDEAVYLGSLLPGIHFSGDDIQMVQGETRQGEVYEEFYPDEEALMDTVLDVFFNEVDGA